MENLTGGTPPVRYLPCVVPCKLYFIDVKANKCLLARDHFGIKPLYYYKNSDVIVFSSELTPIHSVYKTKIDRMSMELLFSCRFIPSPHTIYENVYKLCAGEYIVVKAGKEKHIHYFQYNKQYDIGIYYQTTY